MSLRYSPKPVVVAPFQMVFGGGCEMVLHGDRVRAAAETYIGLVEVGVGIIPAGGGTKEMLLRALDSIPKDVDDADPFPFVKRAFETIALAKVATSAEEARIVWFPVCGRYDFDECRSLDCRREEGSAGAGGEWIRCSRSSARTFWRWESGAGDFETRHSSDEARGIHFGSRCDDWREAGAHSDRRRSESSDARFASSICWISSARRFFRWSASARRRNGLRRC